MPRLLILTSLLLTLALGAVLRLYQLPTLPAGFFCDEAAVGYNAYSLLHSGKDEYGLVTPVFFPSFGEYKSPISTYFTVVPVALFGLSEFSTRLTSAFFGILAIPALFALIYQSGLSRRYRVGAAVVGALCLTVSPWHIHFSRVNLEGLMPAVTFCLLGLNFFFRSLHRSPKTLLIAGICFTASLYSYFPARLFIPLFGLVLGCLYLPYLVRQYKWVTISVIVCVFLLTPMIMSVFSGTATSRWQQVSIFSHPDPEMSAWEHVTRNYLSHFSADFLFTKGDIDMPGQFITRHSVRGMGELYRWQLPFMIAGALLLMWSRRWRWLVLLAAWLVLYPVGSMFTLDKNVQATRSILGVVPWQILTAFGCVWLLRVKLPACLVLLTATVLLLVAGLWQYTQLYFPRYNLYSSDFWGWQYGQGQIVNYFVTHRSNYDDLITVGEANAPDIFFKFYDPTHLCGPKCRLGDPLHEPQIIDPTRRQLFALNPRSLADSPLADRFQPVYTLYYPDTSPAFVLGSFTAP